MPTINFGIDLGTTNSLIAKYHNGQVEVFKNPLGLKETLPSVVGFRKEKILVGEKAREFIEKDPENVFATFKRKMGTHDSYFIKSLEKTITPIELSAIVLKELKNFVYTGEQFNSIVITIPASFDTIQSNATKKAGYEAGFKEVILLQEPIAASVAYANRENEKTLGDQWLVYDLGGGTFDVALIRIKNGEMKVMDHEGNNFLGGMDFDNRIVEKIIIPYLSVTGKYSNLEDEMKSFKGKHNKLYYKLLNQAEEAKKILSQRNETEIEFEIETDEGETEEIILTITREQFEAAIKDLVQDSVNFIKKIIERNNLDKSSVNHILMVGGSTYVPLVRNLLNSELGIPVNFAVDPTTAVAVGAAYFAGTKTISIKDEPAEGGSIAASALTIKTAYQKTTQGEEEFFSASVLGKIDDFTYRLTRDDGGFDSGIKKLTPKISEILPLLKNTVNCFSFVIFDLTGNKVPHNHSAVEISHGKFSVLGQPLPNDICLEIDDKTYGATRLEVVFEKNAILPLKKRLTKEITRTIKKDSSDSIIINIVEGNRFATPASNLAIGSIQVSGKQIERDLIKGSDIELQFEMTESRDLKINALVIMTDQEFGNVFNPSARHINLQKLKDELLDLAADAQSEVKEAEEKEDYELAASLSEIAYEADTLKESTDKIKEDDVTDTRYQAEDKKRQLAQKLDQLIKDKKLTGLKTEYFEAKEYTVAVVDDKGNESDKKRLRELLDKEKTYLQSENILYIRDIIGKFHDITWRINERSPDFFYGVYITLCSEEYRHKYTNKKRAEELITQGEKAMERQNASELRAVVYNLINLLPDTIRKKFESGSTGIG
jgi:molecular chaperone DnaK